MATKNAHVFASSSFGFGYILIFSNRKKEDNTTATTKRERRETRKAKTEEKKKKTMFCVSLSSSQKSFGAASCSFRASNRREDDDGRRHHRQSFWNGRRHATQKKMKKMKMNTNTVAMGNVNDGGLFAPVVVALRPLVGVKRFNKLRGKVISLHSQLIGDFCTEFGATTKQRQKMIKTAKANGGKLGFLA